MGGDQAIPRHELLVQRRRLRGVLEALVDAVEKSRSPAECVGSCVCGIERMRAALVEAKRVLADCP